MELLKILIITVGIMGFKLKTRRLNFLVILPLLAVLVIINDINILLGGLLAVGVAVLIIEGKRKILCTFLAYLSISMLDITTAALTMFITGIEIRELYNSSFYVITVNCFSIMLISSIAIIRRVLKKPCLYHIRYMRAAYIVTSIISQICFLLYLSPALILGFDGYSKPVVAVGLSFSGIFFIISNFLLVESVFSKNRFKSLYRDSREQSENLLDYVDTRIITAKEKQKIYHDIPYHLLSLQSLAENNNINELENYINRLVGRLIESGITVNTGSHQLNAIISGCIAKYPETEVEINGIMPNEINIPHHDLCIILSNLLDNAFKMSAGTVKIEVKYGETLYIRIMNSVRKKVKISDNIIQSAHGIGLLNVGEYVDKNNGKVFYHCNDKCFVVDLYLPL